LKQPIQHYNIAVYRRRLTTIIIYMLPKKAIPSFQATVECASIESHRNRDALEAGQ
jgi:hypothetical protein